MGIGERLTHLEGKIRGNLASILPAQTFIAMYSLSRNTMLNLLAKETPPQQTITQPTEFKGIRFRNDLGNAAGYDKDGELLTHNYFMGAGFGLVGTVLEKPHEGNRLGRTKANPWTPLPASQGAINSLGLPSKGIDNAIRNIQAFREAYGSRDFPIGISIMGHPQQEGERKTQGTINCLTKALPYADFIEINESCPNIKTEQEGTQRSLEERIQRMIEARDQHQRQTGRYVPLFVKLGSFEDTEETIRFMTETNIDGLVGLNTQKDYTNIRRDIDERDKELFDHYTKKHEGGISGQPIKKRAQKQLQEARKEIQKQQSPLRLIHVGGIQTHEDLQESRAIGKEVILREWYTGMMHAMATQPFKKVYQNILTGER